METYELEDGTRVRQLQFPGMTRLEALYDELERLLQERGK